MNTPLKDYFLIGNLHSAALVSNRASIDWLCWPRFDSSAVFAHILDEAGGQFKLNSNDWQIESKYLDRTAVVEHKISGDKCEFNLSDYMQPLPYSNQYNFFLTRKLSGTLGESEVKFNLDLKPDFARSQVLWERLTNSQWKCSWETEMGKDDYVILHLPDSANFDPHKRLISTKISTNQEKFISLEYVTTERNLTYKPQNSLAETIEFWHGWVAKGKFFGDYQDKLVRSAITIKLMQYFPSGAIVAAPTTSIPEQIGGSRNWDYRYVWIRDATFTLYALTVLGYEEEAERFFTYIEDILTNVRSNDSQLAPMYTVLGNAVPKEIELSHLQGYQNSGPVRVGNGANSQFQLDVYGTLVDAYYFADRHRLKDLDYKHDFIKYLVNKIKQHWHKPDSGIWEIRDGERQFSYSKVMCWVGVDRALEIAEEIKLSESEKEELIGLRSQINEYIWDNFSNQQKTQMYQTNDNQAADATTLLMPLVRFLDRHADSTKEIIMNTVDNLTQDDLFVFRYKNFNHDGIPGTEGSFMLCIFWMISALAKVKELETAKALWERVIKEVLPTSGLMSEEIDPDTGKLLGNFPQAFSHLGLIMSAYYLHRYNNHKDK